MTEKKLETFLVNAGRSKKFTQGAINPVIQRASSFIFDSFSQKNQATEAYDNSKLFYGRRGTLTHFSLQKAISELEGGAGCMLYPCGMAAITHSIFAFVSSGDHILLTDSSYESTKDFCKNILKKMKITTTLFDPMIGINISNLIQENTRIVMLESPGSIIMEVQDIPSIVKAVRAKKSDIIIMLDNTWSAGMLLKALPMGIDISIQSGTKYILGHSDAMIGTAVANVRCFNQLREQSHLMGQIVDADTAYMASRGLRTLSIRLKQHEKSSFHIAKWLVKHPEVEVVNHPALPSCIGHKYFLRDFIGANGLFSFVLKRRLNEYQLSNYLDNFKYFKMAYSWGGYESLILAIQPECLAAMRPTRKIHFSGTILRLHVGLENCNDLIDDLVKGFSRITKTT